MKSEEVIGKNLPKLRPGRFLCLQVILDTDFVLANLDAPRCYTSPLVKQGLASDRDLPGLQSHACKRAYVYYVGIQISYGVISMIIQFLKSIISQSASNAPLLFS